MAASHYRAVIFDLGGVILPSPFEAWAAYERELGLEVGFIRGVVAASGDHGAWARHERGELGFAEFLNAFERECADAGGESISAAEVMTRLTAMPEPRPEMIAAVEAIRDAGLKTGAITNNWLAPSGEKGGADEGDPPPARAASALDELFDVIVESAVEGLRKPDPRIYELACSRLDVAPTAAVFLDDLGVNLKPARRMGMETIKVVDPHDALGELEGLLGLSLR